MFREKGIPFLENEPLKNWCTFRIGGKAKCFAEPTNAKEIAIIVEEALKRQLKLFILGRGSNLLFSDDEFNGIVLHLGKNHSKISTTEDNTIYAESGALLSDFCLFALEQGLTGMEELYGIPGSVGGAVYMNAGAYGKEIKEVALSACHVNEQGEIVTVNAEDLNLSYRHSIYSDNGLVIVGLTVKLARGNPKEIRAKMDDVMSRRKAKQPLEFASAGSTFKRPIGNYASALIDSCGLKGHSVGDAQVSEKHAGFVINRNDASFEEVMKLIDIVKTEVYAHSGIMLECEIKIIT